MSDVLGWAQVVATAVMSLGGISAVVALLKVKAQRTQIYADAGGVVVNSSLKMLEPLEQRANELETRSATLQRRVNQLESMVDTLKDTLAEERRLSRREINRLTEERDMARDEAARLRASNEARGPT